MVDHVADHIVDHVIEQIVEEETHMELPTKKIELIRYSESIMIPR